MSRFSNNSNCIMGLNCEIQSFEDPFVKSCWIPKPNVFEFNFSLEFSLVDWLNFCFIDIDSIYFRWLVNNHEYSCCSLGGFASIWSKLCSVCCCKTSIENCHHRQHHSIRLRIFVIREIFHQIHLCNI